MSKKIQDSKASPFSHNPKQVKPKVEGTEIETSIPQSNTKKDQGWLSFINEKLTEWPMWVKLTSFLKQEEPDLKKEEKEAKVVTPEILMKDKKAYKLPGLPWILMPTRERFQPVY